MRNVSAFLFMLGIVGVTYSFTNGDQRAISIPIGILITALIISPIWEQTLGNSFKLKWFQKLGLCLIVWITASSLADLTEQKPKSLTQSQNIPSEVELLKLDPNKRAEVVLEPILLKALSDNMNNNYKDINVNWNKYTDGLKVEVRYVISDGQISGIDEYTLNKAAFDIGKQLASNQHLSVISELKLMPYISGENKYGKEAFDYAATVDLVPSDLRKINWSSFDYMKFRKYLESSNYLWLNQK